MSANTANTDSGLSGQPSDNIDKQKGPASGSNVESPGGTLGTATQPIKNDNNSSNQGSTGSSGNNNSNAQQQSSTGSSH